MKLDDYEQKLMQGWEDTHKKGQLSLWIFLALRDGAKHMADIKTFISQLTDDAISADDKSMYRALRRFEEADMLTFRNEPSNSGPDLKIYYLTDIGAKVLQAFIDRQIQLFYKPAVKQLISKVS